MTTALPGSILFCCDHNAVRSPMAEGLMKKLYGQGCYVQSAGVKNDLEIDGFAVAVCQEVGIELARHKSRSFHDMQQLGEDLSGFDLIVALSPASHELAQQLTPLYHLTVEFWPILDPTGHAEAREEKLARYRMTRDQIHEKLIGRFGTPTALKP